MRYPVVLLLAAVFLVSCASTEEQLPPQAPPIEKKRTIEPVQPERVYSYTERYYVKNAVIGDPKDVDDPLQAIRVIQLQPGGNEVLVISSFDELGETTLETWLGIEMPKFEAGKEYDLATATRISYYRFYLGDDRKRSDASSATGRIKIERNENGEIIGAIDAKLQGVNRAIGRADAPVEIAFSGSFRIQEEDLENTILKSR
ncbi:MAG: hypothetical protein RBU27_02700 [Bacteroidota bacterium]|jgi:hypothetical protein|nr:hypothetical protein [Bacteroidota bacterium]